MSAAVFFIIQTLFELYILCFLLRLVLLPVEEITISQVKSMGRLDQHTAIRQQADSVHSG